MRRSPADPKQGGVVLIITVMVVMIAWALVAQLSIGTRVAYQAARNQADRVRLEAACHAVADQLFQALADDAAGVDSVGGFASMADEAMSGFGADPGGDFGGEGGEGGEEEEEVPDTANSDSRMDAWARPMRVMMGDIQVTTWVQDENGKYNLLTLLSEDEEFAEESRDIIVRILDLMRDEFDDDLNESDALMIVDEIEEWLQGRTRDEEFPRAIRHSDLEDSEHQLMISLEELMLLEHIDEELFYDQLREDEKIAAGLETVFTIYTSIDLEEAETALGADPGTGAPGAGDGAADAAAEAAESMGIDGAPSSQDPGVDGGLGEDDTGIVDGGMIGALDGDPPIGTAININTSHRAVLEGLMDPIEFSDYVMEAILEYRNEVDEEALEEDEEIDEDLLELERSFFGTDEETPYQFFASLDELTEVQGYDGIDQEARSEFEGKIGVQSDIFSVYMTARIPPADWRQEERYEEPIGPVLRLMSVVWRRNTQSGAKFIILVPWHEVPYSRWTIPDFQDDLEEWMPPEYF